MRASASNSPAPPAAAPELLGVDYVEFYVGNARQATHFYRTCFGFEPIAYRGPETGVRGTASYVVRQGSVRFVLTAALRATHPVARHVDAHGDGVFAIALGVGDAVAAHAFATAAGATSLAEPTTEHDDAGSAITAAIAAYGQTRHVFVERSAYAGCFLPGYRPYAEVFGPQPTERPTARGVGIRRVDHCVGNVERGELDRWVGYYRKVLGFELLASFDDREISTPYSALMSRVLASGDGRVKFPINEPAEGLRRSQIEEFLDAYGGPGVQHIALSTDDIVSAVRELRRRGVGFLRVPDSYYESLASRVGDIDEDLATLRELGILVDRDDEGYLLQIFTLPVQDRPTVFFEIIQRRGATGFGRGNFKALFEAIEREQARRGW